MQVQKDQSESISSKDDDIQFDRENITSTDSQSPAPEQPKTALPENTIMPNKDLVTPEIVPLSEEEKQPKLDDEERINEINRKTSLGD
ncbi:MAG: hypothetical protein WKF97_04990 [Chitinophagaceae bacterium]